MCVKESELEINLFRNALHCIASIKEIKQKQNRTQIRKLQDWLIQKMICTDTTITEYTKYSLIEFIDNITIRAKCLLEHILHIESSYLAIRLIKGILLHNKIKHVKPKHRLQLSTYLQTITIYAEIAKKFKVSTITWCSVHSLSESNPEKILSILLQQKEYELCCKWSKIHPLDTNSSKCKEMIDIFQYAIRQESQLNQKLFKLIESLPMSSVCRIYSQLLMSLQNVPVLKYLVDWLQVNTGNTTSYQNVRLSLKIFELSTPDWGLLSMPLLIIEQLLMNSRFEILARVLTEIRSLICDMPPCKYCYQHRNNIFDATGATTITTQFHSNTICDSNEFLILHNEFASQNENCISTDCIDSLLRIYASKALDFRLIESQSSNDLLSQTHDQTMASLDSLCGTFIMPREPVKRSKWIRDEEASHCMCCRKSVFTFFFTRRHHCRYCGRVVCYACSTKRMSIPTLYADVMVRVCDDCFKQMQILNNKSVNAGNVSTKGTTSPSYTAQTRTFTELSEWQFSGNSKHDELVREEFSFEYAPSVTLCLSILAFHSSNPECGHFLLYHCRKFESLLRPLQPGYPNPEIDYALVTRMLHCLALATKVIYNITSA